MKLVFYNQLNRAWLEKIEGLRREFSGVDFVTGPGHGHGKAEDAEAIVAGELAPELLGRLKHLKMIFVPYAGPDALPLAQIKARGIRVANVHGNAPYVAERAVAMALAFYGRIIDYHNDLKAFNARPSIISLSNAFVTAVCTIFISISTVAGALP